MTSARGAVVAIGAVTVLGVVVVGPGLVAAGLAGMAVTVGRALWVERRGPRSADERRR